MSEGAIHYPVRTPTTYWLVVGALIALGLVCAGLFAFSLRHGLSLGLAAICLGLAFLPAIYLRMTREYRAMGSITLATGSIAVPDWRGEVLTFAADRLRIVVTPVKVRVTVIGIGVGDISRGVVIDLAGGGTRRRISTLTLVDPDQSEALLADLDRVLRGEAPRGPDAIDDRGPPPPVDVYAAQLERELAALD